MSNEMQNQILNDLELQAILWACLDYWSADSCAPSQAVICYKWVERRYRAMFGGTFHQSRLAELERLGVLAKDGDTSRGGDRRYYRILDPVGLSELLKSGGKEYVTAKA
jgi:hypothetical protein